MKRTLILTLALLLIAVTCFAQVVTTTTTSKAAPLAPGRYGSAGYTVTATSITGTYINDGKNYGLAFGGQLWRQGKLHADALAILEPTNKSQIAGAMAVGYDIDCGKLLTKFGLSGKGLILTPMVGELKGITAGYDGREGRAFWGLSATVKW